MAVAVVVVTVMTVMTMVAVVAPETGVTMMVVVVRTPGTMTRMGVGAGVSLVNFWVPFSPPLPLQLHCRVNVWGEVLPLGWCPLCPGFREGGRGVS